MWFCCYPEFHSFRIITNLDFTHFNTFIKYKKYTINPGSVFIYTISFGWSPPELPEFKDSGSVSTFNYRVNMYQNESERKLCLLDEFIRFCIIILHHWKQTFTSFIPLTRKRRLNTERKTKKCTCANLKKKVWITKWKKHLDQS